MSETTATPTTDATGAAPGSRVEAVVRRRTGDPCPECGDAIRWTEALLHPDQAQRQRQFWQCLACGWIEEITKASNYVNMPKLRTA